MSDLPLPDPVASDEALDIQHDTDPAQDHGTARHIPHIGHALILFSMAFTFLVLCEGTLGIALHITTEAELKRHLLAGFLAMCLTYVLTLSTSWILFRVLWRKSFLVGISWTARAARRYWWQLVLLGFVASALAQGTEYLLRLSGDSAIHDLLLTPMSAWVLTLAGVTLIPAAEEIAFRGFLLPALATAYDWLSLERTPAGLTRWSQSTAKSRPALIFGAVLSSLIFALFHGSQLHWAKAPIVVLFFISLVFSAVCLRLRSVAAATLVHIAYDGLIFLELIFQSGGFRHLDKII